MEGEKGKWSFWCMLSSVTVHPIWWWVLLWENMEVRPFFRYLWELRSGEAMWEHIFCSQLSKSGKRGVPARDGLEWGEAASAPLKLGLSWFLMLPYLFLPLKPILLPSIDLALLGHLGNPVQILHAKCSFCVSCTSWCLKVLHPCSRAMQFKETGFLFCLKADF